MIKRGFASLPLHYGKAPLWLFSRMVKLSYEFIRIIVSEFGTSNFLNLISDPIWFQSFGCVLGFDWHSSGVTTTVCGAIKEALKGEKDLGLFIAGGKGKVARNTPIEIEKFIERYSLKANPNLLKYCSRMAAKVDTSGLQDGYNLYHHTFIFNSSGSWAVIQQGMNEKTLLARRYHWVSEKCKDFVNEPHSAICCDQKGSVLNMVAEESHRARETVTWLSSQHPEKLVREIKKMQNLELPRHHEILIKDLHPDSLKKILLKVYETDLRNFEQLLSIEGVGPKTIRALALISELIYNAPASIRDPVKYSFAHGGKDGHPYPVDRKSYDTSIEILRKAVEEGKIGRNEKMEALRRLAQY